MATGFVPYMTDEIVESVVKQTRLANKDDIRLILRIVANAVATQSAANVVYLEQTISNPPTQEEVQALSDKVDELLAALILGGVMAPPAPPA